MRSWIPQNSARVRSRDTLAFVLAGIALAASCAGCSILGPPARDASRYFVFSSIDTAAVTAPNRSRHDIHFGLGPIKLPGYLSSQNLVRTSRSGRVEYLPTSFWAEPISDGFSRALLYRTGARLGTTHGIAYPWYSTTRVDWKVPVDVLRFEATDDGHAILIARWSVHRTSDGTAVAGAESVFQESTTPEADDVVNALSRCVDQLAETIAAAIVTADTKAPRTAATR